MPKTTPIDVDALVRLIATRDGAARSIVAIVGAPGSGKSTLTAELERRLEAFQSGSAAVLPMDGYHYDDAVLNARGLRSRKGAPETFDVGGLLHMLERLKRDDEDSIAVPVFDRALEISRAGARLIPRAVRRILVEGNYLLLDAPPWSSLRGMFDITVAVVVPEPVLRARLVERWRGFGIAPDEIDRKVEGNDLPNGRLVATGSIAADFTIENGGPP